MAEWWRLRFRRVSSGFFPRLLAFLRTEGWRTIWAGTVSKAASTKIRFSIPAEPKIGRLVLKSEW
jgi:hypothetical protein